MIRKLICWSPRNSKAKKGKKSFMILHFNLNIRTYITLTNIVKTVIINSLNIGLLGGLFYISFGFCAVWTIYAPTVLILWALVLVADFVVMEITLELFILLLYCFRNLHSCFAAIMRFLVALKNLRNYH